MNTNYHLSHSFSTALQSRKTPLINTILFKGKSEVQYATEPFSIDDKARIEWKKSRVRFRIAGSITQVLAMAGMGIASFVVPNTHGDMDSTIMSHHMSQMSTEPLIQQLTSFHSVMAILMIVDGVVMAIPLVQRAKKNRSRNPKPAVIQTESQVNKHLAKEGMPYRIFKINEDEIRIEGDTLTEEVIEQINRKLEKNQVPLMLQMVNDHQVQFLSPIQRFLSAPVSRQLLGMLFSLHLKTGFSVNA